MKKLIVGVAAALALTTSSAVADGPYRRPPPTIAAPGPVIEPAPTWSGIYFGLGIGAGTVVHDLTLRDDLGTLERLDGIGGEGIFGTVIVGWDWQVAARTVFGVFVDYDFSNISTDRSVLDGLLRTSIDHTDTWSVGARLGWLSSPATLWYFTGGYTEAEFDASHNFDGFVDSGDHRFSGYFVGAGVDTQLWNNWFLRLEYRFSQFDSETTFSADGIVEDVEPSMHTARLTLTYKFTGMGSWNGWSGWGMGR